RLRWRNGRLRKNLLGKRVDYSGRSVIVVGPELRLHQCGLPKMMALELFKPFIYHGLLAKGIAPSMKSAKKMIEKAKPEVWDVLEEVVREHPVFLNRAPTLHRLGFQAFEPVLTEGKAIRLHPLACTAFNADFDGDQMAVHVPLSVEAQSEARVLAMSTGNLLSPANGKPVINPTQDIVLGIYFMTRERPYTKGEGKIFSNLEEVRIAHDANQADLHARIRVRMDGELVETTVGRILLKEALPEEIPFSLINRVMKKDDLAGLIDYSYRFCGEKKTVLVSDRLKDLGFRYATVAGISISVGDMLIPSKKATLLRQAEEEIQKIQGQYAEGLISDGERYNKVIDIWAQATESVADEMLKALGSEEVIRPTGERETIEGFNPIYMMVDSGARGSAQQVRQLAGMRGLMAKPSGEIIETPITASLREGLTVLQYFISTHGARKGLADTALKTANAGYLTRRLVDVAQDVVVTEHDCGTLDGIEVASLIVGGEIVQSIKERLLGRVSLEDVRDPFTGEAIVKKNQEIDEALASRIEDLGLEKVKIRSVLCCESRRGVCSLCYGRDLSRGRLVSVGEVVGIMAAQSIGEPGTQLTMRTFHIGGTASRRVEQTTLKSPIDGKVRFINLRTVKNREGDMIVMNRNGKITILDEMGRERRRYPVLYGATLCVEDGEEVKREDLLAKWDPYSIPILTERSGRIIFEDIIEGATLEEQVDELTGFSRKVIIKSKSPELRPRIIIQSQKGRMDLRGSHCETQYLLPVGAHIFVSEGDEVQAGDILVKVARETMKTKDITGGLPRVIELFEARTPKEYALISDVNGIVEFGNDLKGKRKVIIRPEVGEPREYIVPLGKFMSVSEGDFITAGEPLIAGPSNPHDILRVLGDKALARYLVDEIQEIYTLQGAKINDKHIEVIVRQMLKRVRIKDPGGTRFLVYDMVEKEVFKEENERMLKEGSKPATAEPAFLGITKASLMTESFISAASFRETTQVLTRAAAAGRIDHLKGLKENVIVGRLIPAGTGFPDYRNLKISVQGDLGQDTPL
ncbi:MAG: DNA-directed RNA polymerase subunit beta', partial [Deltaproteobacteria bacterium]